MNQINYKKQPIIKVITRKFQKQGIIFSVFYSLSILVIIKKQKKPLKNMSKINTNLHTKTRQQWTKQGKDLKKQYVFYEGLCLDMGYFKNIHPGGSQVIKNYLFKDVTDILYTVFPHNKQRVDSMLEKYIVGKLDQPLMNRTKLQGTILKWGRYLRDNPAMKKSVKFPSEINKLASQKQKLQQSKRKSKKKKHNNNSKNKGSRMNMSLSGGKQSNNNKKCLNPSYLQSLKLNTKRQQPSRMHSVSTQQQLTQVTIKQIDSSQSITINNNSIIDQSMPHISINDRLLFDNDINPSSSQRQQQQKQNTFDKLWMLQQEFVAKIRVPVMTLRFDRVW